MTPSRPTPPTNVQHFAINADDLPRTRRFYERVFGWRFEAWGPPGFFMISTGTEQDPGILGSLQKRRELTPNVRTIGYECSIGVADVDAVAAAVVANGGEIIFPRTLIPTVGYVIFFRDPDGNVAGAMQYDSNAGVEEES